MEFINYFCEDKDGLLWQFTTLSPHGTTAQVRPWVLLETTHWLFAAIVPCKVCNGTNS